MMALGKKKIALNPSNNTSKLENNVINYSTICEESKEKHEFPPVFFKKLDNKFLSPIENSISSDTFAKIDGYNLSKNKGLKRKSLLNAVYYV